ncbi:MAG: NAD(P)/FAD-dependent oxidoreductase [Pseudomonadota bacterium]
MSAARDAQAPEAIIVGAGPAGMAAASILAEAGAAVLLLDENPAPGGQIWRGVDAATAVHRSRLGADYAAGRRATRRLAASGARHLPGTTVWQLSPLVTGAEIGWTDGQRARLATVPVVILATGAQERPFPIAGWTLPGVMSVGGAQTLLKSSSLAAEGAVFAGTGPLLYLVVAQYLAAGVPVAAVLETTAPGALGRAAWSAPAALRRPALLAKGLQWIAAIRRAGVRHIRGVRGLRVLGETAATGIAWRMGDGRWREIATEHVFLHQGVVPSVNLSMAAGLAHRWCPQQLAWVPRTDAWGQTGSPGLFVAGDGAGIAGWQAAEARGAVAAQAALVRLGRLSPVQARLRAAPDRRRIAAEGRLRPFLDAWFRPAEAFRVPEDPETVVCRCEEITAGALRAAIAQGLAGPNQLKSFTRAGMGPCQARSCALTLHETIAHQTGRPAGQIEPLRFRPPVKPLSISELADMTFDDGAGHG